MAPALAAVAALFLVNWYSIGEYFFRLFSGDSYGFTYADPARFFFLNRALRENPHFVIILVIWISAFAVRFVRERKFRAFRPSRIELSGLLLILLILVYPDKLPFWLSCESFVLLFVISQNLKNRVWSWVGAPITVFAVANGIHWYSQFRVDSNKRQQDFVEIFEDQLRATPAAFVYDGIGITPNNRPSPWFLGPGQKEQNLANLERIARRKPDIILMAHKLQIFFTQIQTFMIDNYVEPQPGLFIRSANVRLRHPERPAVEIQNAVYQYFEEYRTATTRFAIFIFRDGEWRLFESRALSLRDLARLPAICERCEIPQNVRLSAFGSFFARKSDVVIYNDFRFESERPRPTLVATLIHLSP